MPSYEIIENGYVVNLSQDSLQVKLTEFLTISSPESGSGDMTKSVYDPNSVEGDAFNMDNMVDGETNKVLTQEALDGKRDLTNSRFGTVDNNTEFEADGTMKMSGSATVWEDIQGSLIGRTLYSNQGSVDYDFYENTVLFSQNGDITDRNDFVAWNYQYPHSAKADGELRLHMHYERVDTTVYEFTLWYRVQNTGGIKNTAWIPVVVSTADRDVFPYVSGTLNQIVKIVEIDMTGFSISSQMQFRFTRTDSNGGTVAATFIDGHFERDTLGSNEEFVK